MIPLGTLCIKNPCPMVGQGFFIRKRLLLEEKLSPQVTDEVYSHAFLHKNKFKKSIPLRDRFFMQGFPKGIIPFGRDS